MIKTDGIKTDGTRTSRGFVPTGATALVAQSRMMWNQAVLETDAADRFRQAHVAALRGAAAVLRLRPTTGRGAPTSAWRLLDSVAPELSDWSAFFRDSAVRRAAIEAGATSHISPADADELVLAVGEFLTVVSDLVDGAGLPLQFGLAS